MIEVSSEDSHPLVATDAPYGCIVHRLGGTAEIVLEGELDLVAKPALDEALAAALEPGPVDRVVVDFTAVTFADSTTLTWLVHSDAATRAAGGELIALAGPGPVRDVLELTGIDKRVTMVARGGMLR